MIPIAEHGVEKLSHSSQGSVVLAPVLRPFDLYAAVCKQPREPSMAIRVWGRTHAIWK